MQLSLKLRSCGQHYFNGTGKVEFSIFRVFYHVFAIPRIGVGAQSTLGGYDIFARKICIKN